jgi:2-keto-4-pentenoate hydratase
MTPVSYIQFFKRFGTSKIPNNRKKRTNRSIASKCSMTTGGNSIAASFVRARRAATALPAYPGVVPVDSSSAYAVQESAIDLFPDSIAGWKVARIAPNWPPGSADKFPEPRLNGPAFSRNIHMANEGLPACPVFAGGFAAVETEVVIRVGRDAPSDKTQWTLAEAMEFVGAVHIGIEVASSPLATLNELGAGAVISDFGNNWGIVVGKEVSNWRDIVSIDCEAFIDGISVGARSVSMEQGPLDAFAFTLGKCASRGRPLRAGMWITTGMITGVHDIRIGQQSRHVFAGIGEVGCRIVRAVAVE